MSTITEDFVSFEVAKLLKEKGFSESCYMYYDNKGDISGKYINPDIPFNYSSVPYYLCPSQSMAMKWLRDVHKLSIEPFYMFPAIWEIDIKYIDKKTDLSEFEDIRDKSYNSYEEAVEAALKYTLEKLI